MARRCLSLCEGLMASGMDPTELWLGFLALGGKGSTQRVFDLARGLTRPGIDEYNVIAQALNDFLIQEGQEPIVGYWGDRPGQSSSSHAA